MISYSSTTTDITSTEFNTHATTADLALTRRAYSQHHQWLCLSLSVGRITSIALAVQRVQGGPDGLSTSSLSMTWRCSSVLRN